MKLRAVLSVLIIAAAARTAAADGLIVPIRPDLRVRSSWAVKYHKVHIRVRDQVSDVTIDQAFVNTGRGMIEVQYLFPIPPTAAIDSLTLMVDGKEFKGRIMGTEEARRAYEEIVRTKRDPALLEYVNFGLYRTSAFPLLPGKDVRVAVHYTDICRKNGDLVEVLYPLNTEKFSSRALDEVEIKADVRGKGPISAVYSPTHTVVIDRPAPDHVIASYRAGNELPSGDFRLMYQETGDSVGATVLSYHPDGQEDGYFLMMVSPTPHPEKAPVIPKDLVIALDRSGSMSGDKMDQAKASLAYVLRNLNPGDHFNVIAYNDSIESLFQELVPNEPGNVEKALGMVDRIRAEGGTNIHDALAAAVKAAGSRRLEKQSRYILYLTDGLPTVGQTNESAILKNTAEANGSVRARIAAMGIGYDVNVRLLDRLVGENRGTSEYVREREPLEPRISSLYNKLKNPVMTDISVSLNGVKTAMTYPQVMPDLFEGDQILLVGRYDRPGSTNLVLSGSYAGKSRSFRYPVNLASLSDKFSYAFVEQLWAMRRIGFLLDQIQLNGRSTEVVDELVRLSKQFGIITPYTSFLADERTDLFSQATLRRKGEAAARDLISNNTGGVGQMYANNRALLNNAVNISAPSAAGNGSALIGQSSLARYEAQQTERVAGVQNVSNRALYKRGHQWIDSTIVDSDLSKLSAGARTLVQFSDDYFRLVATNSITDNQIFATQQPGEELLVSIRGQVYRIMPGK